jgi:hypothetical protein
MLQSMTIATANVMHVDAILIAVLLHQFFLLIITLQYLLSYGLIEQSNPIPKGNRRISHNKSNGNLNLLEMLHVILGHIPESTIKRIVKNNLVNGLKFSYEQIKNLKLGLCPTCMMTKMKAFPIYPTIWWDRSEKLSS